MKRLVIYFFYDKDGVVDDYVFFALNAMKKFSNELLFVANGTLKSTSRDKIKKITNKIMVRENVGFDVYAYKDALNHYGWDKLNDYDEIILMNYTMFGPVYPLDELFNTMNKKTDLDFWGITVHNKVDYNGFVNYKYNYIPMHIQSNFIAIRKSLFSSIDYQDFWANMPEINSYGDSVGKYESIFTKDFADKGFKWDTYVPYKKYEKSSIYPLLFLADELLIEDRVPFIKRSLFSQRYNDVLLNTDGHTANSVLNFVKNNLEYNVDFIWNNTIRTMNLRDITNNIPSNFIKSTASLESTNANVKQPAKIALMMHLYFEDLIEEMFNYAQSIPEDADVYITSDSDVKIKKIKDIFNDLNCNKIKYIKIENRGRDVSALLVGFKEYVNDYDLVCFAHDKKTAQLENEIVGQSFAKKCLDNILYNKTFVQNIINTFNDNPKLGLLAPPYPFSGPILPAGLFGITWVSNFHNLSKLCDDLKLDLNLDITKEQVAPLGTMFWFRPNSLKVLFDEDFKYTDFPKEPTGSNDGNILHAIERVYGVVPQFHGYYSGFIYNQYYAESELRNMRFILNEIGNNFRNINFIPPHIYNLLPSMDQIQNNHYKVNRVRTFFIKHHKIKQSIFKIMPNKMINTLKKIF